MSKTYKIAVVPGDGIGHEIVPVALDILDAAVAQEGVTLERVPFAFGAGHYKEHGAFMTEDGLDRLKACDAILFGAVGLPDVDDRLPAKDYTFKVRCSFKQYVNYRPVYTVPGVKGPLVSDELFDFIIVRENNEGEFILTGSEHNLDDPEGFATQMSVFTRKGIEQVAHYAFKLARKRRDEGTGRGLVTNVTKSNTLIHSLTYWDRVVGEVAENYSDIRLEKMYVDAAAANFVLNPQRFDVVLTTNMIGDILSDLGGAVMGGLGLGPSGNINPEKDYPSMFEPIHGSAPDIAGKNVANPVGQIMSGALMLEHLGEQDAADRVRAAVNGALESGLRGRDLGGSASTSDFSEAIMSRIQGSAAAVVSH